MLVHYLLHRWEAIELVCKAISKYEAEKEAEEVEAKGAKAKYKREFTLEEFKDNSAIIDALRKYSSKDKCYEFTDKVFSGSNRQLLYSLVLWIKSSRPIVLSETELTALLKYIGERGTLDRYHNIMPQEFSQRKGLSREQSGGFTISMTMRMNPGRWSKESPALW